MNVAAAPVVRDRAAVVAQIARFLKGEPPKNTRVLVVRARQATGLSTLLDTVSEANHGRTGAQVIDDVQRKVACGLDWLRADQPIRLIAGLDVDDAEELGVQVEPVLEELVARRAVDARLLDLPPLDDQTIASVVLRQAPRTHPAVAEAFARHVGERVALIPLLLGLPDVCQRTHNGRIRMVPDQVERLPLSPRALLEQLWLELDMTSRRTVVAAYRLAPARIEKIGEIARRANVESTLVVDDRLQSWLDTHDGIVLPCKRVRPFIRELIEREAPIACEVLAALEALSPMPASPAASRKAKPAPRKPPSVSPHVPQPTSHRPAGRSKPGPPPAKRAGRESAPTPTGNADRARKSAARIERELQRFGGPNGWRAPAALRLRRDLVAALREAGDLRNAAGQQQILVNLETRRLGEKGPSVANDRLVLAELLAAVGDKHAPGAFGRAIGALRDAYGNDSTEVRDAKRRRRKALPSPPDDKGRPTRGK